MKATTPVDRSAWIRRLLDGSDYHPSRKPLATSTGPNFRACFLGVQRSVQRVSAGGKEKPRGARHFFKIRRVGSGPDGLASCVSLAAGL